MTEYDKNYFDVEGNPVKEDASSTADFIEDPEISDPFSPENIGVLQFIMLSRIYDLLMVDFNSRSPDAANAVLEAHKKGHILGPVPQMTGDFLASAD